MKTAGFHVSNSAPRLQHVFKAISFLTRGCNVLWILRIRTCYVSPYQNFQRTRLNPEAHNKAGSVFSFHYFSKLVPIESCFIPVMTERRNLCCDQQCSSFNVCTVMLRDLLF